MRILPALAAMMLPVAAGCGGGSGGSAEVSVQKVEFCRKFNDKMQADAPLQSFSPDDKVLVSISLKGRPKQGALIARLFHVDKQVTEFKYKLADANGKVLFSAGGTTSVGFTFTPQVPWPVSKDYRVDLFHDENKLGSYKFSVETAAKLLSLTLAETVDEKFNPVTASSTFKPGQTVYAACRVDAEKHSRIAATWYVSGKLDPKGSKSLTYQEDVRNWAYAFSFIPEGGWPAGAHEVVILVNDEEAKRLKFTVE